MTFFWGVITGAVISYVGALFGVALYLAAKDESKQIEKNEEG
jgi:small basic protein